MRAIGIDLGSSSIKGAVLDLAAGTVGEFVKEEFPAPVSGLTPGAFEVEPAAVLEATRRVVQGLLSQAPDCAALVWCSQMGGVVLVDAKGNPVSRYLSWRDQRALLPDGTGTSPYARLRQRLSPDSWDQSGHEIKPGSALSLLFCLQEQGQLPASAIPLSLGDFVLRQLCGAPAVTHSTQVLGTLNVATGDWHHAALHELGLSGLNWPRLIRELSPVCEWRQGARAIPCYPIVGDQQSALLGTDLLPGELSVNVSTGSQVSCLTKSLQRGDFQTRDYFDGLLLNTITHLPAGRSLNVLVDLLSELTVAEGTPLKNPWKYIAEQAAEGETTDLTADLAFFAGPRGDHGSISGITVDNLRVGTLFRAAFENMADNYRLSAAQLLGDKPPPCVVLSGGLVQQVPILRELILREFPCPARMCELSEETFQGLLRISQVATGLRQKLVGE